MGTSSYDLIVTGGGPAGMTAAMCAARLGLHTVVIERMMVCNQIVNCERLMNVPGFPEGIHGADFSAQLYDQAMRAGAQLHMGEVTGLQLDGEEKLVIVDGQEFAAKAVILAHGSSLRRLGVPGEQELYGSGVASCATCNGPLFSNQVVGVVGGGDSAVDEALALTTYASEVVLMHRRGALSAQAIMQPEILEHPKVRVRWNTVVEEVLGGDRLTGVAVQNVDTGARETVELQGLFVTVGLNPNTSFLKDALELDGGGHIVTDVSMQTSVPGVFAAGDVRQRSVALIASAAGDGATAAVAVYRHIQGA